VTSYCLDTSAYCNFRRGNEEVATLLDRAEAVGVPTIALGELRTGFLLGRRREHNEAELATFIDHPAVKVFEVDAEVSRLYAEIVVDLRKAGTRFPPTTSGSPPSRPVTAPPSLPATSTSSGSRASARWSSALEFGAGR
jgi:predicted nucleic acid-binding protein